MKNLRGQKIGGKLPFFCLCTYCVTASLELIHTPVQECVLATGLADTTPTAKKLTDIRECHQHVGTTFSTCQQKTKMSVL